MRVRWVWVSVRGVGVVALVGVDAATNGPSDSWAMRFADYVVLLRCAGSRLTCGFYAVTLVDSSWDPSFRPDVVRGGDKTQKMDATRRDDGLLPLLLLMLTTGCFIDMD
jgi:hypothetical protein